MKRLIENWASLSPEEIREGIAEIQAGNSQKAFKLAANILTYNWIEGNDRTEWQGKDFDWHPVARENGKHHYMDWFEQIHDNAANMFLAGRKHTKTTFADCLMVYRLEFNPGHVGLYWSNTKEQVKDRMQEFDEIVEANPWLTNLHGTDTATFSKSYPNGAKLDTAWVTGAYEGGHVDTQIGDDPMKELGDISDSDVEHWYGNVIVPTLNPGETLQAIIGTRKRPNDLYEILRRRHDSEGFNDAVPGYNLVEYPAIREAWQDEYERPQDLADADLYTSVDAPALAEHLGLEGDRLSLLWPEARDVDFLLRNLGMQGESYFLREYCMVYTQVEDAVVHREWIDNTTVPRAPPSGFAEPWTPAAYPDAVDRSGFDRIVIGHDPAGKGRDNFAWVTLGVVSHPIDRLAGGHAYADSDQATVQLRHVLDAYQAQDVPPSRWREKLTALHDRYEPDTIAIESNLNQTWTMSDEQIPDRVRRAIEPIATGRGKHNWEDGVPGIGSDIEAGKYRFYVGGGDSNMTEALITALTSVQRKDGELVGHTPDLVMALYMADRALETGRIESSRSSLRGGSGDDGERETRRTLRGNPVGEQLLDQRDSLR